MTDSINKKIARASLILIVVSVLGHVISLGKEMLVAAMFGIGRGMDAFYAAIAIPNYVSNVLGSTFLAVFIPAFARHFQQDRQSVNEMLSGVLKTVCKILIAVTVVMFILADQIVGSVYHGLSPETTRMTALLLRISAASVIISGLIGIISAVMNTAESFAWPAVLQVVVTLSTITFLLLGTSHFGVSALVYGLVVGLLLQLAILAALAYRRGYRYRPGARLEKQAGTEMAEASWILFIAIAASQVNMLVDRMMASYLAEGSIALLGYADKLIQVPLIIFSGSISVAIFPYFSRQAAANRHDELNDSIGKSIRMSAFLFIPMTLILIVLAEPVIRVLFERGAFTPDATHATSIVFICYAFQLFFYTISIIFVRAFLALQFNMLFMKLTLCGVVLNVCFNLLFMKFVHPPVAGIALSTSIVLCLTSALYIIIGSRHGISLAWRYIAKGIGVTAVISIFMALILRFAAASWGVFDSNGTIAMNALRITASAGFAILVFLLMSSLMRLEEVTKIRELVMGFRGAPRT